MKKQITVRLKDLHDDQAGGAYTLSYVMVIPFLMLIVALIVESTLMMSAKLGTVYAAYAAARSASVYGSPLNWGETSDRAESAGLQAMMPFASGSSSNANSDIGGAGSETDDRIAAFRDWNVEEVSSGYLKAKAADVSRRLQIRIDPEPSSWDSDLVCTVTYDFPFHVPGIGQLLGEKSTEGGYVYSFRSQVRLQNEGPQNARQELGIGYGSN